MGFNIKESNFNQCNFPSNEPPCSPHPNHHPHPTTTTHTETHNEESEKKTLEVQTFLEFLITIATQIPKRITEK